MKARGTLVVAALVVLVLMAQLVAFQVRETERAVVLTFGEATREISEPGLYGKWPWPVEQVVRFDARLRVLEGPLEECQTADGKMLVVGAFICWHVKDPLAFLKAIGSVEQAERQLERDLRDAQGKALGRFPWSALVAAEREKLRWDEVEAALLDAVRERAARQYRVAATRAGEPDRDAIAIAFVGIRRLALPEAVTESVFKRMTAELEARAAEILAEGDAEAARLRAEAERDKQRALDQATADERRVLAEAERAAAEHYAVFGQDEDLAIFLRKLDALKRILARRSAIVLDTRTPPFDLLGGVAAPGSATPHGGGK